MKYGLAVAALAMALLILPASAQDAEQSACEQNFVSEGSFFSGKSFRSVVTSPSDLTTSMRRIAQALAAEGWQDIRADTTLGMITANQTVMFGDGAQVPLNFAFEEVEGGTSVSATFNIGRGRMASEDAMRSGICELLSALD